MRECQMAEFPGLHDAGPSPRFVVRDDAVSHIGDELGIAATVWPGLASGCKAAFAQAFERSEPPRQDIGSAPLEIERAPDRLTANHLVLAFLSPTQSDHELALLFTG
jgi:hypothetical protein